MRNQEAYEANYKELIGVAPHGKDRTFAAKGKADQRAAQMPGNAVFG